MAWQPATRRASASRPFAWLSKARLLPSSVPLGGGLSANSDSQPSVSVTWRLKTDAGLHMGGWNIDDVELFSLVPVPVPDVELRILPEQASLGNPMSLSIKGTPNMPALLVLGDNAGPTPIPVPGAPDLLVGGSLSVFAFYLDGAGNFLKFFNAPTDMAAVGTFWHGQIISLDASVNLVVSNKTLNLFQ